jgi:hypothetical protein
MINIDTSKLHDLTLKKIYDDNDTGAVINKDGMFGFQVLIKGLPSLYKETGIDFDEAYVKNYGQEDLSGWMSGSVSNNYMTTVKSTHLNGNLLKTESDKATYYASFVVWLKPGETFKIHGLPEGASYAVKEVADTLKNEGPDSAGRMFDISYTNNSGTISEEDVKATVTNTLRTVDLKLSKEVLGYDDGRMFYLAYT